jgi:opacity protein-like surface antigen
MRRLAVGSLVGILALSMAASAGERGWYVGVEGGANWVDVSGGTVIRPACGMLGLTPCALSAEATSEAGLAVFGVIGRQVTDQIRLEGELGYRMADFAEVSDISNTTLMVNAIFDVSLTDAFAVSVGAGVGYDWVDVSQVTSVYPGDDGPAAAFQLIAGARYELANGIDLTANYRYLSADIGDNVVLSDEYGIATEDTDISTVTVGLRFDL